MTIDVAIGELEELILGAEPKALVPVTTTALAPAGDPQGSFLDKLKTPHTMFGYTAPTYVWGLGGLTVLGLVGYGAYRYGKRY